MAAKKTYENAAGTREQLDPNDPQVKARIESGELREVPAGQTGQGGGSEGHRR